MPRCNFKFFIDLEGHSFMPCSLPNQYSHEINIGECKKFEEGKKMLKVSLLKKCFFCWGFFGENFSKVNGNV